MGEYKTTEEKLTDILKEQKIKGAIGALYFFDNLLYLDGYKPNGLIRKKLKAVIKSYEQKLTMG
jgi:hypothetical protein